MPRNTNRSVIELSDASGDEYEAPQSDSLWIDEYEIGQREVEILRLPWAWFTDEIINAYFRILSHSNTTNFYFNSFFYSILSSRGLESISKWKWPSNAQRYFIPINHGNSHWALSVFDLEANTLAYYDSMQSSASRNASKVLKTLEPVFKDLTNKNATLFQSTSAWETCTGKDGAVGVLAFILAKTKISTPVEMQFLVPKRLPRQQDSSSCGPFVCKFAQVLSSRQLSLDPGSVKSWWFSQKDVNLRHNLLEIFQKYANKQR